jgi:hypothetical protein
MRLLGASLGLLLGGLVIALVASGWTDVRRRQRALRLAPRLAAAQRGGLLAQALGDELAALLSREAARPLIRYAAVTSQPDEPLVLGYFEIAEGGETLAPPGARSGFRDEVARSTAGALIAAAPLTGRLAWRTLPFAGQPALIAMRRIAAAGEVIQGVVVDRTALTSWLAARAGDSVAELRPPVAAAALHGEPIIAGWRLTVEANPRAVAAAEAEAAALGRGFALRGAGAAAALILAGVLGAALSGRRTARAPTADPTRTPAR